MTDAWTRMEQAWEYWAYSRGVNDHQQGRPYDPPHGSSSAKDQQLYIDGWNDYAKGIDRAEALRRWPSFVSVVE